MSVKNLFVNARTKILEFKRKHNWLVDKVKDVEHEIPTEQQITSLADLAIQADKDILSKITVEYDNNVYTITFPDFIIPLYVAITVQGPGGTAGYFSYKNGKLYSNLHAEVSSVSFSIINNKVVMLYNLSGQYTTNVSRLIYINGNGLASDISSYLGRCDYIFYPITEAGTKLYDHFIESGGIGVHCISNISTQFTKQDLYRVFSCIKYPYNRLDVKVSDGTFILTNITTVIIHNSNSYYLDGEFPNESHLYRIMLSYPGGTISIELYESSDPTTTVDTKYITNEYTDTVTPL